ncbi:MAG: hypothetical protein QOE54_2907 [Streptosporangiaceae bacterium]|jgi:hypothetical protein|nr:hypothetical protein [Streptosporangiaceae bacterium]MDX6430541.1 hypothetical protein [Streptosporangiaceae bacterium]
MWAVDRIADRPFLWRTSMLTAERQTGRSGELLVVTLRDTLPPARPDRGMEDGD